MTLRALTAIALLLGGLASTAARAEAAEAAQAVQDLLTRNWFEIEFFVFERSAVLDANTGEVLVRPAPLPLPRNMIAYAQPGEAVGAAYDIDPETLLCMVYPTIEYTTSPLPEDLPGAAEPAAPAELLDEPMPPPAISPVLEPDPQLDLLAAVAEFERELEAQRGWWQSPERFTLSREARLVQRRGGGRVLFHGRWLQAVPPRASPEPLLLQGGERLGDRHELTGSVNVTLGRYLHFEVALNYSAPLLGAAPASFAMADDGSLIAVQAASVADSFMTMAESRRMRSEELHYLDHPKLGVVVRIDPLEVPERLLGLFEALEEDVE